MNKYDDRNRQERNPDVTRRNPNQGDKDYPTAEKNRDRDNSKDRTNNNQTKRR